MIKKVIKRDKSVEDLDPNKLNKWAQYATKTGGNWSEIALSTYKRLPEVVSSADIHQTMINVCVQKQDIVYSRIAARLEQATIRKNMERHLGVSDRDTFEEIFNAMVSKGVWSKEVLPDYNKDWEKLYSEIYPTKLEYWQIVQWGDKYSRKVQNEPVETFHVGCIGIALALHGDNQHAYDLAKALISGKVNLPTPALNGMRNGDMNSISCCVITGGDTVDSIAVADHIALMQTARKSGIGIEFNTRSKGAPVKGGAVDHLGKHSIYAALDKSVKLFTQVTRGGSATVTYKCIDPEVESIIMWKTQRVDIETRLDKLDFSFAYNDAFLEAVIKKGDWYLFDLLEAPEVHDAFYDAKNADEYNRVVEKALIAGKKYTKVKAWDLLKSMLIARNETGRVYTTNVTRMNIHTPFLERITLSNLCMEIALPTKEYENMHDLYSNQSKGETAFCSIAAINVSQTTHNEYEHVADVALRAVDRMIELATMFAPSMKRSLLKRRSVGIGITGLAGYLYNKGFDYDGSEKSITYTKELAERHYYYLLKASQKMSKESGFEVEGVDYSWLPIDTRYDKNYEPSLDWEVLRGVPRKHSVLVAHMPTESSAVLSNAPNGLYPVRQPVINKRSRRGVVQYICESWDSTKKTAWDVDNITLSKYYSAVQDFTDQAISSDYYFDPSKYDDEKKPLSELIREWVIQAKLGLKTQYYINTRDFNGGSIQDIIKAAESNESEEDTEACETCTI